MKKSSAVTLFLFILSCCCLSGCASLPKNEHMEQKAEQLITALNEDDADQFLNPCILMLSPAGNLTTLMKRFARFGANAMNTR